MNVLSAMLCGMFHNDCTIRAYRLQAAMPLGIQYIDFFDAQVGTFQGFYKEFGSFGPASH